MVSQFGYSLVSLLTRRDMLGGTWFFARGAPDWTREALGLAAFDILPRGRADGIVGDWQFTHGAVFSLGAEQGVMG